MDLPIDLIEQLVARPQESLNTELKTWLDPQNPAHQAKIIKACLALRNRNGGFLVIGFDDKTLNPDLATAPPDVQGRYHPDVIQFLVSKYASEPFEIGVGFPERDGVRLPVVVVPPGVRTVVAAKADLFDGGKPLIRLGEVYFRTLKSNGTVSTAPAGWSDWKDIIDICLENREADIGRFLRRQLATSDFARLLSQLTASAQPAPPTLRQRAETLLVAGNGWAEAAISSRDLDFRKMEQFRDGRWSVALIIDPPRPEAKPTDQFRHKIASSNPMLSGWPIWVDTTGLGEKENFPIVVGNAWQSLVLIPPTYNFLTLDPVGKFFFQCNLPDDRGYTALKRTYLDPIYMISLVAEVIATGIAFCRGLAWDPSEATLGFAFRWTGIASRQLHAWSKHEISISPRHKAHDSEAVSYVELRGDTPSTAIAPVVAEAVKPLFNKFNAFEMPIEAVEYWVKRLIERRG